MIGLLTDRSEAHRCRYGRSCLLFMFNRSSSACRTCLTCLTSLTCSNTGRNCVRIRIAQSLFILLSQNRLHDKNQYDSSTGHQATGRTAHPAAVPYMQYATYNATQLSGPPDDHCQSFSSVASASRGLLVSAVMVGELFLWPAVRYGTAFTRQWGGVSPTPRSLRRLALI